ncbi:hypothetical protein HR060_15440 [Catenovulum sp. SM1970]|uniref:hypothetical protein n=1 Tax=Marinifaba aquimaris TaxID=2741323 RepID=UPI001572B1FC|nr:hypothetical protein [Marinifaba aquimaris]NTS78244.1 hypothetical protein [Marinifaba aquimaris]
MKTFQYHPIAFVNAAGMHASAFYTAIENSMLYAKPSKLDLSGFGDHHLQVQLEPLIPYDKTTRCLLLLENLIEQVVERETNFEHLVIVSNCLADDSDALSHIENRVNQLWPNLSEIKFIDSIKLDDLATLDDNTLLLGADSCIDLASIESIRQINPIQTQNGPLGVTVGEGGVAMLLSSSANMTASFDENEISQQLNLMSVGLEDMVIQAGQLSEQSIRKWFGTTAHLYKQTDDSVFEPDLIEAPCFNAIVGYSGEVDLLMALVLAESYIQNPVKPKDRVYICQHLDVGMQLLKIEPTNLKTY